MDTNLKHHLTVAGTTIGISTLVFAGLFWWLADDIQTQNEIIQKTRADIVAATQAQQILPTLQKNAATAALYKEPLKKFIPQQDQLLSVSGWIKQQANIHRLNFDMTFTGTPTTPTPSQPGNTSFTMRGEGDKNAIVDFLNDIEVLAPRFAFKLNDINLTQQSSTTYRFAATGYLFFAANQIESPQTTP